MNNRFKITAFIFFALSFQLGAQEKWTLDACIAYALEHNLQLNDVAYTEQAGKETYKQSIRNMLPSVEASSSYFVSFGRAEDPNTGTFVNQDFFRNNYGLESSLDIFQGFQKINSIKASKFIYKATQEEALQEKYLLAFRVMQAFYDIQFAEGLVANSKEQVNVSESNYKLVEKQIELGLMAGADLYEAESLLLSDKLTLTQAKNQLAAAQFVLIQEMNLEQTSKITIQTGLEEKVSMTQDKSIQSDSIYEKSRDFLPQLKGQELRVKAAKKQVGVERGKLYPSLSLFAGIGTGYFETTRDDFGNTLPFQDQFRDNMSQYIGLSLSVPITYGLATRSGIKQAKIERLRAENNLKVQEQVLFQTIQQLVQEYNSLLVELKQSTQNMEAQNLAFTIAQKRYEKGLINAIELFTAKNLYASAQNTNLQVSLRAKVNQSTLDFYRGESVFNIEKGL